MALELLLNRMSRRLEELELAEAIEKYRRAHARHGLPFTPESQGDIEAYVRWRRTWPAGLSAEEQGQRAIDWWAHRHGLDPAELRAEAERLVAEHDAAGECAEDCPLHE